MTTPLYVCLFVCDMVIATAHLGTWTYLYYQWHQMNGLWGEPGECPKSPLLGNPWIVETSLLGLIDGCREEGDKFAACVSCLFLSLFLTVTKRIVPHFQVSVTRLVYLDNSGIQSNLIYKRGLFAQQRILKNLLFALFLWACLIKCIT